jgi:hypothetical protein
MRTEESVRLNCLVATATAAFAIAALVAAASNAADSEAAKVAADAVRAQGYPRTGPVSAEREPAAEKADETTWVLVCSDARYRMRFMGDTPPKVEHLK